MCEFPTHFSEFACPDLKLECSWGFHSALKFHSNLFALCVFDTSHHHYFLDDFLDRGRRKIQSNIAKKGSVKTENKEDKLLRLRASCFDRLL